MTDTGRSVPVCGCLVKMPVVRVSASAHDVRRGYRLAPGRRRCPIRLSDGVEGVGADSVLALQR